MKRGEPSWLTVKRVGTKYYHDPDFVLTRPHGAGDYVFVKFLNDAELTFTKGTAIAKPGNCIFISPKTSYVLKGYQGELGNDWMHFEGRHVRDRLAKYNLPLNKIMNTVNTVFVRELLDRIRTEMNERLMPYKDMFIEVLFESLCIQLARSVEVSESARLSPSKAEHLTHFRTLRQKMLETYQEDWTVEKMAEHVFVSSSRFAVLYKEFFGISPIAELLHARIEHAKWLLTNTTLSMNQVASQSGFNNVYYFSRKFHECVGCPPSRFYKMYITK